MRTASKLGAKGVQIYARGNYDRAVITKEKTNELKDMLSSNGLVVSAICGDLGKGFGNPSNPQLIDTSKKSWNGQRELGANVVTAHIGVVPEQDNHPLLKLCKMLAESFEFCR